MVITVYGASYSTHTQSVLFLLEKLGVPYSLQNFDMSKGEHCTPDFTATRHPFGKLPAIQDGEFKLFESRAIARYLVSKHPGLLSLPTDSASLGRFEEAASVEYSYFNPVVGRLGWEKVFKKVITGEDADASAVSGAEQSLRKALDYYENILKTRDWLAGMNFTLIDVLHAPFFLFLIDRLGYRDDVGSRPHVKAWWEKVSQDPDWQTIAENKPSKHRAGRVQL